MDKGLYLYCIRTKTENKNLAFGKNLDSRFARIKFSAEGINGGEIFVIPYQDLEAVVSEVSLEEFGSEEIQKKAEGNLGWIREKAKIHEEAIEQAMGRGSSNIIPVIPMQFGVIFKTKEKLEETLSKNLEKFRKSLDYLTGKQEWGVKTFLNQKVFGEFLEKGSEEILAKKKEAESLPKGMAFFAKKQAVSKINEIKEKELDRIKGEIHESLSQLAASSNNGRNARYIEHPAHYKAKNLERELTGRIEEMILNGFYLIEESKLNDFQKKAEELKEKYSGRGIIIEMTGPWPSYHFA